MGSLFWQLADQTAETQFIFNLFHMLVAGLALLTLLRQFQLHREAQPSIPDRLSLLGFSFLTLSFALLTFYFGTSFFVSVGLSVKHLFWLSHGLLVCGALTVVGAYVLAGRNSDVAIPHWVWAGWALVASVVLVDTLISSWQPVASQRGHVLISVAASAVVLFGISLGIRAVVQSAGADRGASLAALVSLGVAFILQSSSYFLPHPGEILAWNGEQHLLSTSLIAFAWVAGERSRNQLIRVFVRLNLTFIILAGLIMLVTAAMQKYQYLRMTEERSMNLAEFLRGHVIYYKNQGDSFQNIFQHPELLRRVVVEFSTLPELREVNVYLDGQRKTFRYLEDRKIQEEIMPVRTVEPVNMRTGLVNSFPMIRLPIESGDMQEGQVELMGTLDFIHQYITKYIILIYSLFTIMVGVASTIIGLIVTDSDRRLRQQYTELQEVQQQLAQAAKLASIGQLAGGLAHEINTPITCILSLGSHLAGKSETAITEQYRKSLQLIVEQAERASKIVRNLLTFARQSRLEVNVLAVREILDAAITLIQYRLTDSAIVLRREIEPDLPSVLGDSGRLTEVFVNLLNNAIDAMPGGGTLVIRAFRTLEPDSAVRVEVTDTGCSIPPENLSRIFDPFFTTKEPGKGTGLGLSISHGIVKDHGGQIWAQDRSGEGATFVVTLPQGGDWR